MKADLSHELTTNSLKFDFNHFFTVDSKCLLSTKLYGGKLNFASLHTCIVKQATSIFHPNHFPFLCSREESSDFEAFVFSNFQMLTTTFKWRAA